MADINEIKKLAKDNGIDLTFVMKQLEDEGYDTSQVVKEKSIGTGLKETFKKALTSEALPIAGGVVGGIVGSAPGATLGGGAGEAAKQLIARGAQAMGVEGVEEAIPQTSEEAAKRIAESGAEQGLAEATGRGIAKVMGPVAVKTGEALASGVEKTIGISSKKITSLFKKPLELLTAPTKGKVEEAYSKSELFKAEKTLEDIVEEGTKSYAAVVKRAGKSILKNEQNPEVILKGRKALDKQIASLESQFATAKEGRGAIKDALQSKFALREEFNKVLDVLAPQHRQADKIAARQLEVDPFRKATLPGKINFTSPEGIARAMPGLPTAVGLGVAGAGTMAKIATNPVVTRSILATLSSQLPTREITAAALERLGQIRRSVKNNGRK